MLLGVTGAVTVRRRRRLQTTILAPIDNLHDTVLAIRSGDLSARPSPPPYRSWRRSAPRSAAWPPT